MLLLVLLLLRDCFYATAFTLLLTRYLVCNTYCPTDYAILLTLLLTQYLVLFIFMLPFTLLLTWYATLNMLPLTLLLIRYCFYATTAYQVPGTGHQYVFAYATAYASAVCTTTSDKVFLFQESDD